MPANFAPLQFTEKKDLKNLSNARLVAESWKHSLLFDVSRRHSVFAQTPNNISVRLPSRYSKVLPLVFAGQRQDSASFEFFRKRRHRARKYWVAEQCNRPKIWTRNHWKERKHIGDLNSSRTSCSSCAIRFRLLFNIGRGNEKTGNFCFVCCIREVRLAVERNPAVSGVPELSGTSRQGIFREIPSHTCALKIYEPLPSLNFATDRYYFESVQDNGSQKTKRSCSSARRGKKQRTN